jgi:hypothetical protein
MELALEFLILVLLLVVVMVHQLLTPDERSQPISPIRLCPFCQQGMLTLTAESEVAYQRGHSTKWFWVWKCTRCNYWEIADAAGNPLAEQGPYKPISVTTRSVLKRPE